MRPSRKSCLLGFPGDLPVVQLYASEIKSLMVNKKITMIPDNKIFQFICYQLFRLQEDIMDNEFIIATFVELEQAISKDPNFSPIPLLRSVMELAREEFGIPSHTTDLEAFKKSTGRDSFGFTPEEKTKPELLAHPSLPAKIKAHLDALRKLKREFWIVNRNAIINANKSRQDHLDYIAKQNAAGNPVNFGFTSEELAMREVPPLEASDEEIDAYIF